MKYILRALGLAFGALIYTIGLDVLPGLEPRHRRWRRRHRPHGRAADGYQFQRVHHHPEHPVLHLRL